MHKSYTNELQPLMGTLGELGSSNMKVFPSMLRNASPGYYIHLLYVVYLYERLAVLGACLGQGVDSLSTMSSA